MRTLLRSIVVAVLTAAIFPAGVGAKQDPPRDYAFGEGTYVTTGSFDFDASSDPLGGEASGHATVSGPARTLAGSVTCLVVTGPNATIGYELAEPVVINTIAFTHATFEVVDSDPATGPDFISSPILWAAPGSPTIGTAICASHFLAPIHPATGEITVHDAVCDKLDVKNDGDIKCKDKKNTDALPVDAVPVPLDAP
jgi:hypothetical protein